MFNYFDLSIIPTFLSRFKVEKILAIGLSNELILDEIISYCNKSTTLYAIDPKGNNYSSKDDIVNGIATFGVYLSDQEAFTLLSRLSKKGDLYSMEDLYNYIISN